MEQDAEYFHRMNPLTSNTDGDGVDDGIEVGNGDNPRSSIHLPLTETASTSSAALPVPYWNAVFSADIVDGQPNYWKLDLEADFFDQLDVRLAAHSTNNSHARITLYDPAGSSLQQSSYAYDGDTVVLSRQLFTAGTYFLRIEGGSEGNYDLEVTGVTVAPYDDGGKIDAERSPRLLLYLNTIMSTL